MYYGIFLDDYLLEAYNDYDEALDGGLDYMFEYDKVTLKFITQKEYEEWERKEIGE